MGGHVTLKALSALHLAQLFPGVLVNQAYEVLYQALKPQLERQSRLHIWWEHEEARCAPPEPPTPVILLILVYVLSSYCQSLPKYLCDECNVIILLLLTNQEQITLSIDIACTLLYQLLYNSTGTPLPRSLKNNNEENKALNKISS